MINTIHHIRSCHILFALWCIASISAAQTSKPGYDDKLLFRGISGVTVGATTQQWTLKKIGTVSQQSAPISVLLPISNRILFTAASSAALTSLDTTKVSGMVDTRLSLSYVLPGDKFWLSAGASLPTGKAELKVDELNLMTKISQTSLSYKAPVFGQGLGGNIGLAYGSSLTRRLVFGLGTSYVYRGKYKPISGASDYDPGDEISGNAGFNFTTYSKTARMSADFSGSYFFADQFNGGKVFQSGPRIMLFIVYSLNAGELRHLVNVRVRYRLKNTFYSNAGTTEYDATTQVEGQYAVTIPMNAWLTGNAIVEGKYYTADQIPIANNVIETGKARIGSGGMDLQFHISDVVLPMLTVRYAMGNIIIDDIASDVDGFEVSLGVKVSF